MAGGPLSGEKKTMISAKKKPNPYLALGSGIVGVAAVPVVMMNPALGIAMLFLCMLMIYHAS